MADDNLIARISSGLDERFDAQEEISDESVEAYLTEQMAEMEHGRFVQERIQQGWRLGPRDPAKKTSPYLVDWEELPADPREYDREAVRAIPALLARIGFEVRRPS